MDRLRSDAHMQTDGEPAALSFRLEAPMRWLAVEGEFSAVDLDHAAEANQRVLAQIAQFEERGMPIEQPTPQDLEIQRLHAKLDLLLSAVGELAPRFLDRPPRMRMQLSWRNVRWMRSVDTAPAGSLGWVELHLHPLVLQSLHWPARMLAGEADDAEAELLPSGDAAQQSLERYVFQQHRRAVAAARRV